MKKEQLLTVRVSAEERAELEGLLRDAENAGAKVSISDACRYGARLFLLALAAEPTRPGRKPKGSTNEQGGRLAA